MFLEILSFVGGIAVTAVVMAIAGAVAGQLLRTLSRRVSDERVAWLLGDLSAAEAFGMGLVLMTVLVAAFDTWLGAASMGYAWFKYAVGAAIAFWTFLLVSRRTRKASNRGA
ncbi:hypothetical protein SAZ10_20715 [Mesorhizobium sp. BAC0120]|uniref:hypothetical protein n=1 Tax=Mesorhizobium sp. BAC0120 TaxID=3090670 RepID=UPI00298C5739|nr:hypothetical protein [Mesorhizobium sp. BAC0120]MDW6024175.1 hypothetical protein [Mesorhizobium sp. BAC0120]